RFFSVGVTDLSGIQYAPSSHRLLIVSDGNNLLLEVDLTGQVLEIYPLPGKKQEGITIDGDGFLYIAQDDDTALLKFTPLDAAGHTNQ
ncbi:MAG: SdiA-regulated domain-containing protein, partial [Anaerolineales bacterium]